MKDEEWSGLLKVPDDVIIKQLRRELGIQRSEIDELKYLNGKLSEKVEYYEKCTNRFECKDCELLNKLEDRLRCAKDEIKSIKEGKTYQDYKKSKEKIVSLHQDISRLVYENTQLKRKLNERLNTDIKTSKDSSFTGRRSNILEVF